MGQARYPSLFQINTRVWLNELSRQLGRAVSLDRVPDAVLDAIAERGFDWVWLLGVWQTGTAGAALLRNTPQWRAESEALLPDLADKDICGSPFGIQAYTVHPDFGGNEALQRVRHRLHERNINLLLDFVPNHTALDHPWVWDHPEYFINGSESDLARAPKNYERATTWHGARILAHGRDPYFPAWEDTLQLNYRQAGLRGAMRDELARVAALCDGVRCDMAMLLLPEVITKTWASASLPADGTAPVDASFWPEAIARVRELYPQFLFVAEAYWDLEWTLQQQGFDYTYDKRLYDRLHARDAEAVRSHLGAGLDYQDKLVRFLENHDEPRAASAFPLPVHKAAAVVTYLVPGLRMFHEGQFQGRRVRISMHLGRRPDEPVEPAVQELYDRLLGCLRRPEVRNGRWQLVNCRPTGPENRTWNRFIAFLWEPDANTSRSDKDASRLLIAVNYGPSPGQCYVHLPLPDLRGRAFYLRDLMSPARYERDGADLATRGLFLDVPEWGFHVFEMAGQ